MASGDLLCAFTPHHNEPPFATPYATLDQITAATSANATGAAVTADVIVAGS